MTVNVNVVDNGAFASSSDTGARTVTITMGTTTATLTVSTVDDSTDEANGTITATVETGMGYTVAVAPGNSAMVTVTDDDGHGGHGNADLRADDDGSQEAPPPSRWCWTPSRRWT